MFYLESTAQKMIINSRDILDGALILFIVLAIAGLWLTATGLSIFYTLYTVILGGIACNILTKLFYRDKFNHKNIYLIFVTIIVIIISSLIFNQTFSPYYYEPKLYSYIIIGIFTLGTIWDTSKRLQWAKTYRKEIDILDKNLEIKQDDTLTLNNKGTKLVNLKLFKEGLECFDKVLKINPKDAAAWHNKGVTLEKLNKHQEALKYYDKALTLDPKFKIAKESGRIILEN